MKQKQIDLLIYMFEYVRERTLNGINGLTKEQLFQTPVEGEWCIGSYLMHLAECDLAWLETLTGAGADEELKKKSYYGMWHDCPEEYAHLLKDPPEVEEYIDTIAKCRAKLTEYVSSLSDEDLDGIVVRHKNYLGEVINKQFVRKWIITMMLQHEAHTRGQMFMLIRQAGFKKKGENN
jgi:uncharacterized damage-inducible protein DinB